MGFVIEKGVELPPRKQRPHGAIRQTLDAMSVGDSVVVECKHTVCKWSSAAASAGKKVASRSIGDGRYRVWYVGDKEGAAQ